MSATVTKADKARPSGRAARFWACVAPNDVDGRVNPGHDTVFCRQRPLPTFALCAPNSERYKSSVKPSNSQNFMIL